jgi:hypothetical protein
MQVIQDYLLEEYMSKYRFLKELKCLGELRHDFTRLMPIIARSKLQRVPKNHLMIRQGEPMQNIYFIK